MKWPVGDLRLRLLPDPVLRQTCEPVSEFDDGLSALANTMLAVMYDAKGRGLAAPQVGQTCRIFVMDASWKTGSPEPEVFVNPDILTLSDRFAVHEEGCLSIPGQTVQVARPDQVTLQWQDVDGQHHTDSFSGFRAVCVQHEIDHLNGVLCIDYPEPT